MEVSCSVTAVTKSWIKVIKEGRVCSGSHQFKREVCYTREYGSGSQRQPAGVNANAQLSALCILSPGPVCGMLLPMMREGLSD